MRCKKHPSDLSSSVGVCASCLRERLFSLIAAQAQQAQARPDDEDRRISDSHPPPLVFPRSVSPYITRRRADDSSWLHHHNRHHHSLHDQRFYSTPQVGPITTADPRKKHSKFSLFSNLFTSRSGEPESDLRVSRASLATSSSSSSWFSSLLPGRRKNKSRLFSLEEVPSGGRRPCRARGRGMSPANWTDDVEDCEDYDGGSPSASGYSSESSQGWKKTPTAPPAARRRGQLPHHSRNVSNMAFCLSPLVRASPKNHRNQKGVPPDLGFSGEIRAANKPHLSTAASFCANRSRKLADFGKFNHNP